MIRDIGEVSIPNDSGTAYITAAADGDGHAWLTVQTATDSGRSIEDVELREVDLDRIEALIARTRTILAEVRVSRAQGLLL